MKRKTNAVEDDVVNTFAISAPSGVTSVQYAAYLLAIRNFYNVAAPGASSALASWFSEEMSTAVGVNTHAIYDITGHLDGSPHGSPIYEEPSTFGNPSAATPLPAQVCVAVTLLGNAWATTPVETPDGPDAGGAVDRLRQRRTGKLYLGPLQTAAIQEDATTNVARVNPTLSADIRAACDKLAADIRAVLPGSVWCVWSRADEFLYTITHVQVDRRFDTQRRRAVRSSVRDQTDVSS